MDKFYKIGNFIVSEGVIRAHSVINIDERFIVLTAYKIDAGSPENAKRAVSSIARILGAEDLITPEADEHDADGWIPWSGGFAMPVSKAQKVDVRLRDGTISTDTASYFRWLWSKDPAIARRDIVFYRNHVTENNSQNQKSRPGNSEWIAVDAPDTDGWMQWSGGECPVDNDDLVQCRLRNGQQAFDEAGVLDWSQSGMGFDIIAYRVVDEKSCGTL